MSGRNVSSISAGLFDVASASLSAGRQEDGVTAQWVTVMFSVPSMLKLCMAAMHNSLFISQYRTFPATFEKNHESTPRPPVRSASFQPVFIPGLSCAPPAHEEFMIWDAIDALYVAVELLLHCSAESLAGNMRPGFSCHSCTFPRSFLRLSMQFTASSMSIPGHFDLSSMSLAVSSFM